MKISEIQIIHQKLSQKLQFLFQVAIKNDINAFYFATTVPLLAYFREDGQMEKREFLEEWKSIPEQNEQQFTLQNTHNMNAGERVFFRKFF